MAGTPKKQVKKAVNRGAEAVHANSQNRADNYFLVYYTMKPRKGIKELGRFLRDLGVRVSDTTLFNYHKRYNWQDRIMELDSRIDYDPERDRQIAAVRDMNSRQARLGEAMQGIAAQVFAGIDRNALDAVAATRMAKEGVAIERLAQGEATSRSEIEIQVYSTFIRKVAVLFQQINTVDDPDERLRRFASGTDSIIREQIPMIEGA
tara:strand:- start:147 stop:764 length:618 start_codon:yes stop_codon:yes gene_type:complete